MRRVRRVRRVRAACAASFGRECRGRAGCQLTLAVQRLKPGAIEAKGVARRRRLCGLVHFRHGLLLAQLALVPSRSLGSIALRLGSFPALSLHHLRPGAHGRAYLWGPRALRFAVPVSQWPAGSRTGRCVQAREMAGQGVLHTVDLVVRTLARLSR